MHVPLTPLHCLQFFLTKKICTTDDGRTLKNVLVFKTVVTFSLLYKSCTVDKKNIIAGSTVITAFHIQIRVSKCRATYIDYTSKERSRAKKPHQA